MFTIIKHLKRLLWDSTQLEMVSTNILWLALERVVRFLFGFVVSIWVVRYMGPEQYGIYSYAIAFTSMIGTIVGFGVENIFIRELVKRPEDRNDLLLNTFFLFVISSILAYLIALVTISIYRIDDQQTVILVAILSIAYLLKPFNVIRLLFDAQVQGKIVVPYAILALIISNVLKIYFILQEMNLFAFAWALILENLIASLGLIYLFHIRNFFFRLKFRVDTKLIKQILSDGLPLMLSSFMILVYMRIDQVMLRELVSEEEVGLYSVAVVLTGLWFFVPNIIVQSLFPKIVTSSKLSITQFNMRLQRLYNLVALIGYVLCIPISFLSEYIINFTYGEAFFRASCMLAVLIWVAFFVSLGVVRAAYIYAMNLTRQHLIITLFGALGNIILNFILIPRYEGFGAVIATLISQIFTCFVSNYFFRSLRQHGYMMVKAMLNPKVF